ncbi:SRS domain-containing protein [Neospora caninum Liverpool]|uniref:SRS domain-containing protein n=1 Tax=Neospora caninum (strain Liverpool) TaxID=572307 RepID=F0VNT9_NEOCL|nr:SRS domain-containing protein [Neospora caninum Liverpool]CBZ55385.1 SRS domain-containing protein [Neospora caninum Liverpool]CEL70121.1 TPA: SRS domain-containing protein [Neospora caninum Liverpool]|eukprot:XP_003885413.1 SRS domain-containing protein [Neospora caninum Liverpool]
MASRQMATMGGTRAGPSNWRMAGTLFLVGAVLVSSAVLGSKGQSAETSTNTCTKRAANQGISVAVDTVTRKVTFVCDTGINNVLPSPSETRLAKYYAGPNLEDEEELETLFGQGSQATITPSQRISGGQSTVTLALGKLPETKQVIYFGCSDKAASEGVGAPAPGGPGVVGRGKETKCVVTVTVPADPDASMVPELAKQEELAPFSMKRSRPHQLASALIFLLACLLLCIPVCHHSRWRSSRMPAACTVAKENMNLEINSESKTASFRCDTDIATLSPRTATNIFDESCENEVTLAEKLPSASLTNTNSGYQFTVEELPEPAATFCYKCSAASASGTRASPEQSQNAIACYVKIKVSAANLDSAALISARTLSVPALFLGLAAAVLFAAAVF